MSSKTFQELWIACENFHQEVGNNDINSSIKELELKLRFYKTILLKTDLLPEEAQKIKTRVLGELLLSLTNVSLIDNINVHQALDEALNFQSLEQFSLNY